MISFQSNMKTLGFIILVKNMRPKLYIPYCCSVKTVQKKMMGSIKAERVVTFGMRAVWVNSFFPVFLFSDLSVMSVSYILNVSEVSDEEMMYSLKGRFCLIEELFPMAVKTMERIIEGDP